MILLTDQQPTTKLKLKAQPLLHENQSPDYYPCFSSQVLSASLMAFVTNPVGQRGHRPSGFLLPVRRTIPLPVAPQPDSPVAVNYDGTYFYVCDNLNNRILVYYGIPTSNDAPASFVIGQPDFVSNLPNQGLASPTAYTLNSPNDVFSNGTTLFVADTGNNRILVYTLPISTSGDPSAQFVIGQRVFQHHNGGHFQHGFGRSRRGLFLRQHIIRGGHQQRPIGFSFLTSAPSATGNPRPSS